MQVRIDSLRYPFDYEGDIGDIVRKYLNLSNERIVKIRIMRKSLDARRRDLSWVVSLEVTLEGISSAEEDRILSSKGLSPSSEVYFQTDPLPLRRKHKKIVIVGCGPAGIFAALTLVKRGVKPVIIERGKAVEERIADVERFWKEGVLNEESNVQFGEGGAGTFSDGKLTTRIKDQRKHRVFEELIQAGASDEIAYLNRPHLGSERLISLVKNLRKRLLQCGVEIRFSTRLVDLCLEKGRLEGIETTEGYIETDALFLAIGNSSRDTYEVLFRRGIAIEAKAFAVGLRIEHPQKMIDSSRYGKWAFHPRLGPADYFFTYKDDESKRGVYTFCMCPGGLVIAGSSEKHTVVTNGISTSHRGSPFGNSAVVVTLEPADFGSDHPLAGMYFQRELEKKAYLLGGGDYKAPVQRTSDFLKGEIGDNAIQCTYRPGIKNSNLHEIIPLFLLGPLMRGLHHFEQKMKGFIREGVCISVETKTSSPVRLLRNAKTYHSVNVAGIIPAGEGSGYSGGIVSSAVDGIRAAERFDIP